MTNEQAEHILAEALEDYHRTRARGERPDETAYRERLGADYEEFLELVAAETMIDQAIEPAGDDSTLPAPWGSYTLLREIARGAAGVVYEALHRKLGRKVALKVLRTGVDTDVNARERFRREAQALAHVKHDHIVEIYEFGEIDGRPYYAMSYVDGMSLKALQDAGKAPAPRELCRGLAGVADALATLHAEGIIHRDVKPQNIIVDSRGRFMLADFGLARSAMAETMTQTGDALGTPLYMSPEQMLGDRHGVEERTDVYGLGATMYQLLTGVPPFKTDNLHALMRMILKERPVHPRQVVPDLPEGCARIALQCLEKEPRDRYASAAALRDDLLAFAEGERVVARTVSRPRRGLRLLRAYPLVGAAALVLLGLGIWALMRPPEPVPVRLRVIPSTAKARIEGIDEDYVRPGPVITANLAPNRSYVFDIQSPDETNFEGVRRTIEVGSEPDSLLPVLLATKTTEGATIRTRELLEMDGAVFHRPEQHRGIPKHAFEPFLPQGPVRREDLREWRVQILDIIDPGYLAFYTGDRRLHVQPFPEPSAEIIRGPLPEALLGQLEPGMTVRWGYTPDRDTKPAEALSRTFQVVEKDLGGMLARLDEVAVAQDGDARDVDPEIVKRTLRAELFLQRGLPAAAWAAVQPILDADHAARFAESRAAEREGRAVRATPVRATPMLVALKEAALGRLMPNRGMRDDSIAWNELVTKDWVGLFGPNARMDFHERHSATK